MNHFQAVRKSLKMLAAFLIGFSGDLYPASGKNRTVEGQRSPPKTKRPGLSTRPLKNATILNQLKRELSPPSSPAPPPLSSSRLPASVPARAATARSLSPSA